MRLSSLSLTGLAASDALALFPCPDAKSQGVNEAPKVAAPARGASAIPAYCHEKNRDVQ